MCFNYLEEYYYTNKPTYASVKIRDILNEELINQTQSTTFDKLIEINYPKHHFGNYKNRSVLTSLPFPRINLTNNCTINPTDGGIVVSDEPFKLMLTSRFAREDKLSWVIFSLYGVEISILKDDTSPGSHEPVVFCGKRFKIKLKNNADCGYIQFFQSAKQGCATGPNNYPYGSIITIYVIKYQHIGYEYPYIITVTPKTLQTFVPLSKNQLIQIVTPQSCEVNCSMHSSLANKGRQNSLSEFYDLSYFERTFDDENTMQLIFFRDKISHQQGCVVIPALKKFNDKKYAVLVNPLNNFSFYTHGLTGVILRMSYDLFKNKQRGIYLDKERRLLIESSFDVYIDGVEWHELHLEIRDSAAKFIHVRDLNNHATTTI